MQKMLPKQSPVLRETSAEEQEAADHENEE